MKLNTATISGDPGQSFTERHGGWILSICFHVILFAFLVIARQERPTLPLNRNYETIRVNLAEPAGAALAATAAAAGEPAASAPDRAEGPEPVIAMRNAPIIEKEAPAPGVIAGSTAMDAVEAVDKTKTEAPADTSLGAALRPMSIMKLDPGAMFRPITPSTGEANMKPEGTPGNPNAGGSTETGPASPDGMYAAGSRSKRGDGAYGEGTGAGTPGSAAVGGRIQTAQADLTAQKTLYEPQYGLFAARGASAGAIRSIDLNGSDSERAKEVLGRYGITILMVPAGSGGRDLLSPGVGKQQFVTKFGRGGLGFFRFSAAAANRMGQLEDAALRAHGDDPAKTRIVKVTFGIVSNTSGGYDLGVLDMKTEPLVVPQSRTVEKSPGG